MTKKTNRQLAWLIWGIAAIFYSYEFFIRISPAVMVPDLMATFKVNAAALGLLSGSYYYAYAAMQIPVGALIDRFHVRNLLFCSSALVGVACAVFSYTDSFIVANLARIVMGVGSAFAFISCLKLAANWFSKKRFAVVVGLTNMLGVFGAISAEAPLATMVNYIGWQTTLLIAAIFGLIIALLIIVGIRDYPDECHEAFQADRQQNQLWKGLVYITKCWQTWLVALVGALMVAPIAGFTELWSVPFLMKAYAISRTQAAAFASIMFIGIAVGGPCHGYFSGLIRQRRPVIFLGILGSLITISAIIYLPFSMHILAILLFLFGFFSSSMLLCFTINKENNPAWATGVTIGFTNMKVMAAGTIFQPLIGLLLDRTANLPVQHNINAFTLQNYHIALSLLPASLIIAFFINFFVKESYCKQRLK